MLVAVTARAGEMFKFASDYCPGKDSVCLTNMIASIGTNLMTVVLDGGPWAISNGVVIPSNIELLRTRSTTVTLAGTNTIVENTMRLRQDWLTNLNVSGNAAFSNNVEITENLDVEGTATFYKIVGDGSGITGVVVVGTIDYQIDGTSNIVAGSITAPSLANAAVGNDALADGAVSGLKIGTGVVGTNALEASGVTAGEYTNVWVRIDEDGRISMASNGTAAAAGIVTQNFSSVLTVGNDATGQSFTNAGSGTFTNALASKTVTASTSLNGPGLGITSVSGTNLVSGTVGSAALQSTAVTPATYTLPTIAVDADGRITSASSHALTLTGTIGGSGSTGYTEIGPAGATNSAVFGPFTSYVGVFTVWVFQSGTGQFQYSLKYADDAAMSVNLVTLGTLGDNPDIGADHNQTCTFMIPRGKYVRLYCTTAGSSGYYIRYGILEL